MSNKISTISYGGKELGSVGILPRSGRVVVNITDPSRLTPEDIRLGLKTQGIKVASVYVALDDNSSLMQPGLRGQYVGEIEDDKLILRRPRIA